MPIDALLFNKFAVIVVLSTSYLTYTVIPIYASMKAVDAGLFEAARDLGAGWFTTFRRVLLPLIAPGIFIALLLVYVPLFTDFAAPTLVGGTSGYMLGNVGHRPGPRERQPQRRRGDELPDAARRRRSSRCSPTGSRRSRAERMSDAASTTSRSSAAATTAWSRPTTWRRAGLRTVVCERREIVGGCCVTEEFAPGFRASTGAYVLSMLREPIWRDMRLAERGIVVDPAGPSLHLFADGTRLELSDDTAAAQAAVRRALRGRRRGATRSSRTTSPSWPG